MKMGFMRRALALTAIVVALGLTASKAQGLDLWPLAEFSQDRTMVLYPFYVHEGDFLMAFPFYYRTNQGRDHHFVWPLVKVSEGRLTRVMPLWYSADKDTFTVFPLLRQTPKYTFWSVPPVYTRHDGKFISLFPLFARSPETLWVMPSYYNHTGDARQWNLFPLYFSSWSPERAKYIVPILYYYAKDKQGYSFWLAPFKKSDNGKESEIGLFPLWWFSRDKRPEGDQTNLWIVPFAHSQSPTESSTLILPLFWKNWEKMKDGERKDFRLLPFVQGTAPGSSYHGFLPLYYYESETQKGNKHQSLNVLWPLYEREETTSPSGEVLDYHRRFLIFSDAKERDGSRVFNLLGIPIVERTR